APVFGDETPNRPNVVLVLGDDFSCGELSWYGNPHIRTPNIDSFASGSVRLQNFHVAPSCSPTRAQLFTGKHEARVGVTHTTSPRCFLPTSEVLLSNLFQDAGYATALFGKWHLGEDTQVDEFSAQNRGFDYAQITANLTTFGHLNFFDPVMLVNGVETPFEGYRTDILFDEAMKWIDRQAAEDKPFFCYLPLNNAHSPFIPPPGAGDRFQDCDFRNAKGKPIPRDRKKEFTNEIAGFYGMIENMDENFGRLVAHIKERGLNDNTIVIFMSDNGHAGKANRWMYNDGMRGRKMTEYRGGTRVPFFLSAPGIRGDRDISGVAGGIDLLPTLVEMCRLPAKPGVDGMSLVPRLSGELNALPDRYLVCHVLRWPTGEADTEESKYGKAAIQSTRYRYLLGHNELYDHTADPGEEKNIADQHPEMVKAMRQFYEEWWEETRPLMVNDPPPAG
ncbi:MAG: arylsulfatase, partial [Planctomycetota bacterium]